MICDISLNEVQGLSSFKDNACDVVWVGKAHGGLKTNKYMICYVQEKLTKSEKSLLK